MKPFAIQTDLARRHPRVRVAVAIWTRGSGQRIWLPPAPDAVPAGCRGMRGRAAP